MGKLKSLLIVAVLTMSFLFGSATSLNSGKLTTDLKYDIIKEYVRHDRSNKFLVSDTFDRRIGYSYKVFTNEENTTGHNYFPWSYTTHFLVWVYQGINDDNPGYFQFIAKDYQEFVTANSKGVVIHKVKDKDLDGKADWSDRDYLIVINGNEIIMPDYPKGFVNIDYYSPNDNDNSEFIQRELHYWMKMAGREA